MPSAWLSLVQAVPYVEIEAVKLEQFCHNQKEAFVHTSIHLLIFMVHQAYCEVKLS